MAVSATDVVAPVLAATEVVVFFLAGVAGQTRLRSFFRRFVLEGNDLRRIAFFSVGLAWAMTRLASGHLVFPTANLDELSMRSMGERFELIFVAVFAGFAADVTRRASRWLGGLGFWLEPTACELLVEVTQRIRPNTDPQMSSALMALVSFNSRPPYGVKKALTFIQKSVALEMKNLRRALNLLKTLQRLFVRHYRRYPLLS